jgi:cytochrome b
MSDPAGPAARVRVWDRPVRIFHWLIVLHLPILWWTAEQGLMEQHRAAGYVVLGLLLFRLIWGAVGSSTARFADFVKGPRAVLSYLNGRAVHALGHNPLGGWSVAAMLLLLLLQVALGLFASDEDGLEAGPLSRHVEWDTARAAADWHAWLFNPVLLALIALHIAAIVWHRLRHRDDLVGPMLFGDRPANGAAAGMEPAPAWRFFAAASAAAALAWWVSTGL